jgi:hypothetical protein
MMQEDISEDSSAPIPQGQVPATEFNAEPQQNGPSTGVNESQVHRIMAELLKVRDELAEVKSNRSSVCLPGSQSGSSSFSLGSSVTNPASMKLLSTIDKLQIPDDTRWQGGSDKRSPEWFLHQVSQITQINSLGHEATFKYFATKCVDISFAGELYDYFQDAIQVANYTEICEKLPSYFIKRFHRAHQPQLLIEQLENKQWAADSQCLDDLVRKFKHVSTQLRLQNMNLLPAVSRMYFIRGLPDKLAVRARDSTRVDDSIEIISSKLHSWCSQYGGDSQFFQPRRVTMAAAVTKPGEAPIPRKLICYFCKQPGHIYQHCPEIKAQASKGREELSHTRSATAEDKPSADEENRESGIPWTRTVRVAAASISRDMTEEVSIRSASAVVCAVHRGLLDTGAERTLCSKRLADEFYRSRVIELDDIDYTPVPLLMADKQRGSALGTINLFIDGIPTPTLILPEVSGDLILSDQLIGNSQRLLNSLVSKLTEHRHTNPQVAQVQIPLHSDWPPVSLTWKSAKRPMNNCRTAQEEAKRLASRLAAQDPALSASYQDVIYTWVKNGWLKEVNRDDVRYCFRHFPVIRSPTGPTQMSRCRLVVNGAPLNKYLNSGDCSHRDLLRILVLWRFANGFASADISSAYMRIAVDRRDSPYLGIAWADKYYLFTSLPMGISPSAAFLQEAVDTYLRNWINREDLENRFNAQILCAPYMDDLTTLVFTSSSELVPNSVEDIVNKDLAAFLGAHQMPVSLEKLLTSADSCKILGTHYHNGMICFEFARWIEHEPGPSPLSRRQMLSIIAALYDPFGLLAEHSVQAKLLLREVGGVRWDAPLNIDLVTRFWAWHARVCQSLPLVEPRLLQRDELIIFCDASRVATGVVVLARCPEGQWRRLLARGSLYKAHQRHWQASSKIELLALKRALDMAVYLIDTLQDALPAESSPSIWVATDSEVNFQRFANNGIIPAISDPWERRTCADCCNIAAKHNIRISHVSGHLNIADGISRGVPKSADLTEQAIFEVKSRQDKMIVPTRIVLDNSSRTRSGKAIWKTNTVRVRPPALQLSERFRNEAKNTTKEEWIHSLQLSDPYYQELEKRGLIQMVNGVGTIDGRQDLNGRPILRIILPACLIENVLMEAHDYSGHLGIQKTLSKLKDVYNFKQMSRHVRKYVGTCDTCQRVKQSPSWKTAPQYLYSDGKVFSVIGVDIMSAGGDRKVLTLTDLYSRYLFAYPISTETAKEVCRVLNKVFLEEGPPKVIVCDNGSAFISSEFNRFADQWNCQISYIPRYAAHYAGFYEKSHHILMQTIIALMIESGDKWKNVLPKAVHHVNRRSFLESDEKSLSPFEVFKARKFDSLAIPVPIEDPRPTEEQVMDNLEQIENEQQEIGKRFEEVWKDMRGRSIGTLRKRMNGPEFKLEVGDPVMVVVPLRHKDKAQPRWEGPYLVEEVITPVKVKVNGRVESIQNLKKYKSRKEAKDHPMIEMRNDGSAENDKEEISEGERGILENSDGSYRSKERPVLPKRKAAIDAMEALSANKRARVEIVGLVRAELLNPRGRLLWL